jgi:hypothetical protein
MGGANTSQAGGGGYSFPGMSVDPTQGGNYQFQPLSQVQVSSAHPEAIAQGLGQGIQGLASGALGAYQGWQKNHPAKVAESMPHGVINPLESTPFYQMSHQPPPTFAYRNPTENFLMSHGMENFIANPFLQQ